MAQTDENVVSIEIKKLTEKQVTKREGGEASGGDQPAEVTTTEQTSKVNITLLKQPIKISSREERLKQIREAAPEGSQAALPQNQYSKIQSVPFMLRDPKNLDKYYEPRVAAIGPFHHGKPKYKQAELLKLQLAAKFLKDTHQNEEALLKKIEGNIKQLRECYDEEATKDYDDEYLAWMLFVDGCSTLEFIYNKCKDSKLFKMKRDQMAFAEQDMFLLENQLPYLLLQLLMSSSNEHEELKESIKSFVQMHGVPEQKQNLSKCEPLISPWDCLGPTIAFFKRKGKEPKQQSPDHEKIDILEPVPAHLLDLLRRTMLGTPTDKSNTEANDPGQHHPTDGHNTEVTITEENDPEQRHHNDGQNTEANYPGPPQTFRNVQELQAAGIHFRRSTKGNSLRDISFKGLLCCGFLYLPGIKVDDSMGPKFMNLIAYEMCPDFENDFGVTSYIAFLDSLIDHPDDVKHLRKKGILQNFLGSDEEVTSLFNEIGTDLVPSDTIYRDVKEKIQKHYKTHWKRWMAQFFHEHFSSPWTFLAFIGVLFGLWMSGVQTYYTVYSDPSPCDAVCKYLNKRDG